MSSMKITLEISDTEQLDALVEALADYVELNFDRLHPKHGDTELDPRERAAGIYSCQAALALLDTLAPRRAKSVRFVTNPEAYKNWLVSARQLR